MNNNKTAWVTLATNDSYCLGALVLAHSLKRVNTIHQLVVLITPGVTQPMRHQLSSIFNVVIEVDVMNSGDEANLAMMSRPDLGVTFTKLHCWNLTQFNKCVFLDADVLVVQNCDELFEREELSAAPDVGWPDCFNSGVFVFVPSKDTFKALLDCALTQGSFDGGDQGLLNMFFGDWAVKDIKKHLPFVYNMVSSATYSYLPAFKLFGSQVKIVHFLGVNKPWLQGSGASSSTMSGFLELWWNIFRTHVSPALDSKMAGLAGALAGGERSAFEEIWRRQNWEQGVIDYMGRDSFENIWKRITESAGLVPATSVPVVTVPPQSEPKPADPATQPKIAVSAKVTEENKSEPPSAAMAKPETTTTQPCAAEPTASKVPEVPETACGKKTEVPLSEVPKTKVVEKNEQVPQVPAADAVPCPSENTPAATTEVPKSDIPLSLPETPGKSVPQKEVTKDATATLTESGLVETKKEAPTEVNKPQEAETKPKEGTATKSSTEEKIVKNSADVTQETPRTVAPAAPSPEAQKTQPLTLSPDAGPKDKPASETSAEIPKAVDIPAEVPKPKPSADPAEAPKSELSTAAPPAEAPGDKADITEPKKPVEPTVVLKTEAPTEPSKAAETPANVPISVETPKTDTAASVESPKTDIPAPVETPKTDIPAPLETPKTDIPAPLETPKTDIPSPVETPKTDSKDKKLEPTPTDEPLKEGVAAPQQKVEESKVLPPVVGPEAVKETVKSDSVAPKDAIGTAPGKDSAPPTGGAAAAVAEIAPLTMPSSPSSAGTPELPAECAAVQPKPNDTKKSPPKTAQGVTPPQTPPIEGTSSEKTAPVPPKRKGNKEPKSQNGGKQSKGKK